MPPPPGPLSYREISSPCPPPRPALIVACRFRLFHSARIRVRDRERGGERRFKDSLFPYWVPRLLDRCPRLAYFSSAAASSALLTRGGVGRAEPAPTGLEVGRVLLESLPAGPPPPAPEVEARGRGRSGCAGGGRPVAGMGAWLGEGSHTSPPP